MFKKLLLITALLWYIQTQGMEPIQGEMLVKELSKFPNPFIFKTNFQSFQLEKNESDHNNSETLQLHWANGNLILTKNGTGKIYVFNKNGFERVDKTIYQGAYFGAIQFITRDTLYSVGGYGFWDINGAVRYFNKTTGEWYIHPGNHHVPVAVGVNAFAFYDRNASILYVLYNYNGPEYLTNPQKSKSTRLQIQALNLYTKKWWDEPKILNPEIADQLLQITNWTPTTNGVLIQTLKTLPLVLDFTSDKVFILPENKLIEYIQKKSGLKNTIDFFSDHGIHFYDPLKDSTITVLLSKKELLESELSLITKEPKKISMIIKEYSLVLQIAMLLIMILSISLAIYYKTQLNKKRNDFLLSNETGNYVDFINGLMPLEWNLLEMIFKKSILKIKVNAEEINKILGLESRPLKIQNNQRADVIFTLNEKFKAKLNREDELIIRERMENDKRLFEYSINESVLEYLRKFFEKNNEN